MSIDNIKKMYDSLYKSKYDELVRQKNSALNETANKENQTNLQYKELNDKYNQNRLETQNKYKGLYTGLDNQQAEAKEKYYGDRNTVASQNARQAQQIRDYMAKNNLLQSGENIDAMLRSNTDYSNNMANVYTNEQNTNRSIGDKRNEYKLGEQTAYSNIDNSIAASERERIQKIQELMAYRNTINDDFNSKNSSLLSETESNKLRDINAYNEQIRREQWEAEQQRVAYERQLAAQQASYRSSGSGSSSGSSSSSVANDKKNLKAEFEYYMRSKDNYKARDFLQNGKEQIVNQYGIAFYKELEDMYWKDMGDYYS
ncbi:hypothetical protein [uncultured Clostridium sp.]|uniref:hypothetical protein n=1 Tax=uncultured Clostridium sp. TaxID=59620 RepID=UPI0025F44447|nr:hypothetical protein [uncultured Clostridium sp.]